MNPGIYSCTCCKYRNVDTNEITAIFKVESFTYGDKLNVVKVNE